MNKKKKLLVSLFLLAFASNAYAVFGGSAELAFKVIDEDGNPLNKVRVYADHEESKMLSDENGLTKIKVKKALSIYTGARKEGYYYSKGPRVGPYDENFDKNQLHVIVLKNIKNPIPMIAKNNYIDLDKFKIPALNIQVGYDLEKGEWVAPYGKGVISDFIFHQDENGGDQYKFYRKIAVSFSNEKDGLIPFIVPQYPRSDFVSDHEAPTEGYQNEWVQTSYREFGGPYISDADDYRNYYFRVRTETDKEGNIESAYYGKIYGDFMRNIYYFNPTPNDRNVEFDPKKNLLQDLPSLQRVNRP